MRYVPRCEPFHGVHDRRRCWPCADPMWRPGVRRRSAQLGLLMSPEWFVCVEPALVETAEQVRLGERLWSAGEALRDRAQRRGLRTAVLSDQRSPGGSEGYLVDRRVICDTADPSALVAAARALGGGVAAVISSFDTAAGSTALMARTLGVRAPTPGTPALSLPVQRLDHAGWGGPTPASGASTPAVCNHGLPVRRAGSRLGGHVRWPGCVAGARRRPVVPSGDQAAQVTGPVFSAAGFVEGGRCTIFAWTRSVRTPGPRGVESISTVTSTPPDGGAAEFVRAILAAQQCDFGPFLLEFARGATGPQLIRLSPALAGGGMRQCIEAVAGLDTVDYVVARLLGDPPARPLRATAGAAVELHVTSPSSRTDVPAPVLRDVGDVPGLVAAEIGVGNADRVVVVGASAEQARRRARAAARLIPSGIAESGRRGRHGAEER